MGVKEQKVKLPSLSKVKKALYADWALRVKQRDGWKCLMCGCEETRLLTAHHWYVCDHHAHAARYCVDNGATLCYVCHIRSVHTRADWVTVSELAKRVGAVPSIRTGVIDELVKTELTTTVLRLMWNAMRQRVVDTYGRRLFVGQKRDKLFVTVDFDRQIAVVGNTMWLRGYGTFDVAAIAKVGACLQYTLAPLAAPLPEPC